MCEVKLICNAVFVIVVMLSFFTDYFYYKEHLFIVCELLRDNLYEFYKYNRESNDEFYFTAPRLQRISRQV